MSASPAKIQSSSEPSMEDILSSIRKIISDGDSPASEAPEPAAAVEASAPDDSGSSQDDIDALLAAFDQQNDDNGTPTSPADEALDSMLGSDSAAVVVEEEILELTDDMADDLQGAQDVSPSTSGGLAEDLDLGDIEFREINEEPEEIIDRIANGNVSQPVDAVEETPAVFSPLAPSEPIISSRTGDAVQNAFQSLAHTILSQNARTLEDLVTDMLRPMLKSWIDDNMPAMVERLIRAEIERVARGGR